MLSKFETKSNRVKGISFHPKRPWVLASLHNGTIQLWDYKIGTLVDKFEEHEGPVRGVAFHPSQPLFASGGDDYKIKLWNWKQRRCIFTFNGHLDYIRSVFFHHESPWIISASDDQTIRIWNWQSRNCISILTGHNHYVMCAQFHPRDDLVVSGSMDQTVRVWDISGLRKKHAAGAPPIDDGPRSLSGQPDVFGNTDAVVKYVLEGHSRGINWVAFHPTLPLIVSGGDDRLVKLWRMNETKAWEVDTCRGHYSNVSCVLFHPRQDIIVSNSEDTTIRIWDTTKRTALQTFRREGNRFWSVVAHPELNLFAAGHDSGLIVFKLERERPAHTVNGDLLYYVKDKFLRVYNFTNGADSPVMAIRRGQLGSSLPPRTMSYNPAEHSVMISSATDGGVYEIYSIPRDKHSADIREPGDSKRGTGIGLFVARNRFAVLDKGQILIKDLSNTVTKQIQAPGNITEIFYAGGKNLILVSPSAALLYDTESRSILGELTLSGIRYVVWNADSTQVALLSKHGIIVANRQFEQICIIHETIKIKSAVWDESGVLLYSTLNHLKYALPNGDIGIIKTIEHPLYLTRVQGSNIFVLDRESKARIIPFDPTEYKFKLALISRNYDQVFHIIRTSNLVGQSIVAYLQKKGYPEIALQFVKDPKTRFDLALECGNIDVALEMAKKIERDEYWDKLGQEALRQGNHQVVEHVYQRIKNFDKLSFLYVITGNIEKLKKMHKIAELRHDTMSRYHNALYLGDVEDQVSMLREAGQLQLAYLAAQTHGLTDQAASILEEAGLDSAPSTLPNAALLKAPTPLLKQFDSNWPLLTVSKSLFEGTITQNESSIAAPMIPLEEPDLEDAGDWGADEFDVPEITGERKKSVPKMDANGDPLDNLDIDEGEGWGLDEDIGLDESGLSPVVPDVAFVPPTVGAAPADSWIRSSNLPADHIAAGSFESAMKLLKHQVGVINFSPLKPRFMSIYSTARAYVSASASLPPITIPSYRLATGEIRDSLPFLSCTLASLIAALQEAYGFMTRGKFTDAFGAFQTILQGLCLTVVEKRAELDEIRQLVEVCKEYILGLRLEMARREINDADPKRGLELAAYFTHCQLQPIHLQLAIRSAMLAAFKMNNFGTSLSFANRLLELGPSANVAQSARTVIQRCERNPTNEHHLDYDERNPFSICGISLAPVYKGSPLISCPYCKAAYKPEFQGQLCTVCDLAQVGSQGSGMKNLTEGR